MRVRFTPSLLLIAAGLIVAGQVEAQKPPAPVPGVAIASWQEVTQEGGNGKVIHAIWARNDTTVPMMVTEVNFTNCENIKRSCESTVRVWRLLKPSDKSMLAAVRPARADKEFSATEHLAWRTLRGCEAGGDSSVASPPLGPTRPPELSQIIGPPLNVRPKGVRSSQIVFFVNPSGTVDSVAMTNITEPKDVAEFRKAMLKYVFTPGLRNGCPVSGTSSVEITF